MTDTGRDQYGYVKYGSQRPDRQLEAIRVIVELHPNRYAALGSGRDTYYNRHCYLSSREFVSRAEADAELLREKLPRLLTMLDDFSADVQIHVECDWLLTPGDESD